MTADRLTALLAKPYLVNYDEVKELASLAMVSARRNPPRITPIIAQCPACRMGFTQELMRDQHVCAGAAWLRGKWEGLLP